MMGFLSFKFILFIGATFAMFFLVPKRCQWIVLLFFSYVYYYLCSGKLILILLAESLFVFFIAKVLSRINTKIRNNQSNKEEQERLNNNKKRILHLGVVVVLLVLVIIKYSDFMISNINHLFNGSIGLFNFVLPIGISFYTLQAISYLVDVSKNKIEVDNNVFHFLLYMSYFPQIIQGPIPRYNKFAKQLFVEHDYDYKRVTSGLQLMIWGIAKKVIIADRIGIPVRYFFENSNDFHGVLALFFAVLYGFQIYADFSGGIDAIKGISEVFGIYHDDNFNQPFFSKSVEEFWRRWHITLGSWMKDYVFYPLSLSKPFNSLGKKARKAFGDRFGKKFAPCLAMFIVYFLVGIWHGANWKYVLYGVWNGFFIMSGILFDKEYKMLRDSLKINDNSKMWNIFRMFRTFLICSVGRIISRSDNISIGTNILKSLFNNFFDIKYLNSDLYEKLGLDIRNWALVFICILILLFVDYLKEKGINIREKISNSNIVFRWSIYFALILSILVFGLYGGEYDASSFIYGRF